MKVLVACEESGRVRDAFIKAGHLATSADILPTASPGPHLVGDVRSIDVSQYDLMIAFPPCTRLCVSGARWWSMYPDQCEAAKRFFMWFVTAPIKRKAIENPIGVMSTEYRKPDQIIQPWQFGHGETKATCLWLYGLPKLTPTNIVAGREARIHKMPPGKDRSKERSKTYPGIADAMAAQWGSYG